MLMNIYNLSGNTSDVFLKILLANRLCGGYCRNLIC